MGCVIYTRFSPRRNAAECESCEVQGSYCLDYAKRYGLEVVARFDDEDASGKDEYRPKLWDAIETLGKGMVLLVYKRDRLARNVYLSEQINRAVTKRGGKILAVTGDVDGDGPEVQMIRQVLAAIAEYERKLIAARTSHAMKAYMRQGRRMGGKVPIGWSVASADGSMMERQEAEQEALAEALTLHAEGKSNRQICRALDEKHPREEGKHWAESTLRRYLSKHLG